MAATLPSIEIVQAKQRRLDQLKLRQAREGYATPPEISTEIADLQREITAAAPTTVAESHELLWTLLQEVRADVRRLYWLIPVLLLIVVLAVKL